MCNQVEVSATGRSLVQRCPTEGVCVCYWVLPGVTITLYTYSESVKEFRLRKTNKIAYRTTNLL
jgi:hypothetical protein